MRRLNSACDNLLEKNSKSYIKEKPLPDIAQNIDIREPIGEVIQYCVENLENCGYIDITELKEALDEANRINCDGDFYDFTEKQIK